MPSKLVWERILDTDLNFSSPWWEEISDIYYAFSENLFEGKIFSSIFHRLEKWTKAKSSCIPCIFSIEVLSERSVLKSKNLL